MNDSKKINLIHVVDRLDIGGLENGVVNICNLLDRDNFNPCVCCLNGYGQMKNRLSDDVKVYNLELPGKKSLSNIKKIASFFSGQQADIVHTHAWGAGSFEGILAAKTARVPIIINGEHGSFFERWYQLIIQKILFKMCKANLAVSSSLRDQLVEKYKVPRDKITVIENGVDLEKFSGCYSKKAVVTKLNEENFEVTPGIFTVISVGSLKPEKNQKLLLDAFKVVNHDCPETPIQLLLAGDGLDREMLEDIVCKYSLVEKVFLLGKRTDIPDLLSMADILVSTSISRHEGMSNVMLEAFASGIPVIATKSVGASEVVNNGYNGYLVEENNVWQLSDKIKLLINRPEFLSRLGKNARATAVKTYSIETMVRKYQKLYLQLAHRH